MRFAKGGRRSGLATAVIAILGLASGTGAHAASPHKTPSAPYQYLGYVRTGDYPDSVAIDSSTHKVYTAGNTLLTSFDGDTGAILHTTAVGGEEGVAVDPLNHAVYVSDFLGRAYGQVDGTTGAFLGYTAIGYGPSGVALDQKQHTLYFANAAGGFGHLNGVSVVDEGSGTEATVIPIDERAVAVALDAENHRLYVSHFSDYKIAVIDTGSNQVISTIDLGPDGFVNGIAVDPATGKVWVTSGATGKVIVIDEATNAIEKRISVGYSMWGIGINHAQGLVFASDQGAGNNNGSVAIIDEDSETVLNTVTIGGTGHALAVDPDLDRVYVVDAYPGSDRVVILGVAPTYGPGTLSFSSRNYTTTAGTAAKITVKRSGATNLVSTVHYATSNGTGAAGTDYTSTSGTAHFASGATTATFTVPTTKHGPIAASPTVKLTLSNATGGSLRDPHTATLHLRESTPPLVQAKTPPDTVTKGKPYSYTFTASGSPKPTWSVASGALPAGLTLNSATGKLSGTPTGTTPATFTVRAGNGVAPNSSTPPITLTVKYPPAFTAQSPPTTATTQGSGGAYYAYQYLATGTPAPTFALASGTLPAGMTVVASNGYIAGYARGPGKFTFRIQATNGVSPDAISAPATVTVSGAPVTVTPDPPTIFTVTGGNKSAKVTFNKPYDGGKAITGYTVTASPGGQTAHGKASPLTVTGLTNGTAYTFTATATNSVGTSSPSTASAAVTPAAPPRPPATTLTAGKSTTIRYGSAVTVSAKLTDHASKHAISKAKVDVLRRTSSTGSFSKIATVTTSSTGVAASKQKPTRTTQYRFAFHGSGAHAASTSSVQKISVRYVIAAAAKPTSVKHAKPAKIYGTVAPSKSGDKVTLQQFVSGKWKSLKKTATLKRQKLPNGKTTLGYVIAVTEAAKGSYKFRVYRAASTINTAGISNTVSLKVT